jgi:glycosyltransferase involved in cell wall biosynthesis
MQVDPQYDQTAAREFREEHSPRGEKFLIVSAGYFNANRRIDVLLRAAAELKRRGLPFTLALIGKMAPALRREWQALAQRLGVADDVVFAGFIFGYEEFLGHVAAADVVVNLRHPSMGEASGVAQTALALAKPLIVSDTPATAELPATAAIKIKPDDLEARTLVATLEALAHRRDWRKALGAAGREYIIKNAAWPLVARQFSHFLYEVARRYNYVPPAA